MAEAHPSIDERLILDGIIRLRLNPLPEGLIVIKTGIVVGSPVHKWPCPVLPVIGMASNRATIIIFGVAERKETVVVRGRGVVVMVGSPVAVAIFARLGLGCSA